ncbi:hypothetical protein ARALYDRAFT_892777 [Arabidopsis lyrata subsp. lyrata]|uniref:FBD domain-containing protein n=1 Tax=Arabidopsis lyrata subsp. lyrata TaxID=81972 RepID=D7KQ46_ARALL|nr:hypothetical protein ARALYDRAFT_892777 [Arabidopsis lyrata subsp. lyrata]
MYLEEAKFDGDFVLETLLSSCLVLVDLTVITHSTIISKFCDFVHNHWKVNVDVVFDVEYDDPLEITNIHNFTIRISIFYEVTIYARTLEVHMNVLFINNKVIQVCRWRLLPFIAKAIPRWNRCLESSWDVLPAFRGCSFINLHLLVLELDHLPEIDLIKFSLVPPCILSSVDFLQMKTSSTPSKIKTSSVFLKYSLEENTFNRAVRS